MRSHIANSPTLATQPPITLPPSPIPPKIPAKLAKRQNRSPLSPPILQAPLAGKNAPGPTHPALRSSRQGQRSINPSSPRSFLSVRAHLSLPRPSPAHSSRAAQLAPIGPRRAFVAALGSGPRRSRQCRGAKPRGTRSSGHSRQPIDRPSRGTGAEIFRGTRLPEWDTLGTGRSGGFRDLATREAAGPPGRNLAEFKFDASQFCLRMHADGERPRGFGFFRGV